MKKVLVIGGAGFIGINSAAQFLQKGHEVTILDNFSRKGSRDNVAWLQSTGRELKVVEADIRSDQEILDREVKDKDLILHLAAQVAVTTSVNDPRNDFDINALGTFNVLEAVRKSGQNPVLIYASTNKVYGGLEDLEVKETESRYEFETLKNGVPETRGLDFHSPYGCSKGAADQYVRDYARIYDLNTVVFRQSCIYGPHQFGIEDQGWVAWFIIALTQGKTISIYGNGKQVRDLLFVEDLVNAYEMAADKKEVTKGQVYNIGGGLSKSMSVWFEFKPILEKLFNRSLDVNFADWRPGDQPIFISDISKAEKEFGWKPQTTVEDGIKRLFNWVQENKDLFSS